MSSARAYCGFICFVLVFGSVVRVGKCSPPTCYSRALQLSKEIMDVLEKTYRSPRTRECAEFFPKLFLDVHNSCVKTKLRDFLYAVESVPVDYCRTRPRIIVLKRKILTLHEIISRVCHRDLVFLSNDCVALDTGISDPRYMEDTLQLMEETS
ncbi:cytokine-like protein 1 [Clarias gariepinus]|uniref:cytokine-like protein 1 n=1 Tax=Clarias gariepinus TaxID=13013 RepID=UPI00234CFA7D|nr:cytokine-like protein 1 [Clarias gariepinus]